MTHLGVRRPLLLVEDEEATDSLQESRRFSSRPPPPPPSGYCGGRKSNGGDRPLTGCGDDGGGVPFVTSESEEAGAGRSRTSRLAEAEAGGQL